MAKIYVLPNADPNLAGYPHQCDITDIDDVHDWLENIITLASSPEVDAADVLPEVRQRLVTLCGFYHEAIQNRDRDEESTD